MDNQFQILLKAVLDSSGIGKADIEKVQKVVEKYAVNISTDFDKAKLIKSVKTIVPEIEAELKRLTNIDIKIDDKTISRTIDQVIKDTNRAEAALDRFSKKQKETVANYANTLKQLSSNALDKNAPKSINNSENKESITAQVSKVETALNALSNASESSFVDAKIAVDQEINSLKILVKELQNAETTATSLRAKPIEVIKTETLQKVKGLQADIDKAGVSSENLTNQITKMNSELGRSDLDAAGVSNVLNTLAEAKAELSALKKESSASLSFEKAQIKADSLKSTINTIAQSNTELNAFEANINNTKVTVASLLSELGQVKTTGDVSVLSEKWNAFTNAARESSIVIDSTGSSLHNLQVEAQTVLSSLNAFAAKNPDFGNPLTTIDGTIVSLESLREKLKHIGSSNDLATVRKEVQLLKSAFSETAASASKATVPIDELDKKTFANQLEAWKRVNSSAKQLFGDINQISNALSTVDDKSGLDNLKKKFQEVNSEAERLGLKGKNPFDSLWSGMKDFASWTFGSSMVMQGVQAVKDMNRNVIELDSAMIDLRKVTDLTDNAYKNFLDSSIPRAKELGTAVSDIVEATAEWSKLGYSNINDASKYAELSTIYKNVGDISNVETSIKNINSAMKAFDTQDAEHIIDVYNELGNTMGVSSGDIGQGMQKAASALALTGNSLEQVAALLAGGGEITGEVTELANAAKVGALRLASMKGKLEELGEEYEDIESVSATQTKIYNFTKGQVDIYDAQNKRLKSSYEIWRDIANVFDDIDALDQNSILELLFGKNRANQGAAILKGFQNGQIDKALNSALNSDGSAMKEYNNYMQGIQYSLDRLSASFEELSSTVIDSGLIKFFVDLGNTGVNSVTNLVKALTPLGTLLTAGGGILGAKNLGYAI